MDSKLFLIVEDHPQMAENIERSLKQIEDSAYCTIATKLNKSPRAIQNILENIRKKLDIYHDRSEHDLRMLTCRKAREKELI